MWLRRASVRSRAARSSSVSCRADGSVVVGSLVGRPIRLLSAEDLRYYRTRCGRTMTRNSTASSPGAARVVPFPRSHGGAARPVSPAATACAKCGSVFVVREPAFLHCHYCGAMTRITGGSLLEQELFEIRSGLRLAS
jgi:hypothetical protein